MIEVYKSELDNNTLTTLTEEQYMAEGFSPKHCWFNLVNPSDKEVAFVASLCEVEDDVIKAALDDEERSRIESEDGHLMVLVDIPVIEEEANYYSYFTIPLGTIIKDDFVITVSLKETTILRDFVRRRVKGFSTYKKTRFLFQILNNVATKYLAYLKQIDKASQRIQNELHKSTRNKELIQMLDLENSLVYFSTSLSGNDAVINKLLTSKTLVKMYEEDQDLLEDVAIDTKQAIEMCSIYRDILSGTMDAYASVISNNLNIVMKVLTSVTLIISIPTLIASFFGMNTGVPFEGKSWGFWIVVGISGIVSTLLALYLKKKKLL
ncbi:MAG: magnesium transporter CorA family protein [Christensenellales bacterium]